MSFSPHAATRTNDRLAEGPLAADHLQPDTSMSQLSGRARMIRYARILAKLDRSEWLLLAEVSVLLGKLLIVQRTAPLPDLMAKFDAEPIAPGGRRLRPARLVYLVTGLVRLTLRDRFCMKRSILIFHYLRKWGHSARILFGVVKQDGDLQGHAWVELNGRPLAERGHPRSRYTVTYAYPSEPVPESRNSNPKDMHQRT